MMSYIAACFVPQGTYYGTNGWAGACAGQLPPLGRTWPPPGGAQGAIGIALNRPQYSTNMCGKKIMYRVSLMPPLRVMYFL